jgi:hypothetical protein
MTTQEKELIQKARKRHNNIYPVGSKSSFSDCFTVDQKGLTLWYDTDDRSTHIVREEHHADS